MNKVTIENEKQVIDEMLDFVANKIYKGQFTKDELFKGLHAPDAVRILQEQIFFVARGTQNDETKKYLAERS